LIAITKFFENIQKAYESNQPFVSYRNPNEDKVVSFIQENDDLHYVKNYSETGFVFAPFDSADKAILLLTQNKNETILTSQFLEKKEKSLFSFPEEKEAKINHVRLVDSAVEFLEKEDISKVVVARTKKIKTKVDFLRIFKSLLRKYDAAYVYVWFHPKVGMWVGASPETLLKVTGGEFRTMSLAGTQKFIDTTNVAWGVKELEEQQLVTDYVLTNLKEVTSILNFSEVKTIKAGNLLHLKTDILGELAKSASLKKIIHTLHPTPAVCGFPKETAQDFIFKNENFDRKYYTGFLGELNVNNQTSLFVNLRCMEIIDHTSAKIYVGGGITTKSNSEKEWEETVAKAKTMEASFGSIIE
jgi:isochorismate synthase